METKNLVSVSTEIKQRHIFSDKVILVPYKTYHVPKYNRWMQDKDLQYLTGSEPLNLEEEFEMYESWNLDMNKCTFIVLDRSRYESSIEDDKEREIQSMVGDVNFYILDPSEGIAEIEIMIAEKSARGRGMGREAVSAMMKFGHEIVKIQKFEAKIKMSNIKSQRLFKDYFGFIETSRSEIFEEITFASDLRFANNKLKEILNTTEIKYKIMNT